MMVVLSSRILSAMYNRNRRMYYPLLWRNEWRDTDTHQSSLLDNVATRHNVNDGFGELLRCAHEHRAGYKRIGGLADSVACALSCLTNRIAVQEPQVPYTCLCLGAAVDSITIADISFLLFIVGFKECSRAMRA